MNINKKLQKIGRDLQEIAYEIETSASRPRERKGDHDIIIYKALDRSNEIYGYGTLVTNPVRIKKTSWCMGGRIHNERPG